MNADFLKILRCPVTKSGLTIAEDSLIKKLNDSIEAGTLVNVAGQAVSESVESGLVNEDQSLFLPIRKGIAIMVQDQAIQLT